MNEFIRSGVVKDGEICQGVSWEAHADSVATFLYGLDYTLEQGDRVMRSIDGEMAQ